MSAEIKIAATGDILMIGKLIRGSKQARRDRYDFDPIFAHVKPYLQEADVTIGNLEVPLAGREPHYTRKNRKSGFSMFNCPDELARTLKDVGFDVLTTANNHALDRGFDGLRRTLDILDNHRLAHTGTYATAEAAEQPLIVEAKGIRIGIRAYSKSTNKIPLPPGKAWCIDLLDSDKIAADLKRLKTMADLVIVCPHFGREYRHHPTVKQRQWVNWMLRHGADIVLGSHPHVIEPMLFTRDRKFAIFSMGNFVSPTLKRNPLTRSGVIVQLHVTRDDSGRTAIRRVEPVPTWILRKTELDRTVYRILPFHPSKKVHVSAPLRLTDKERERLHASAAHTLDILTRDIRLQVGTSTHPQSSKNPAYPLHTMQKRRW